MKLEQYLLQNPKYIFFSLTHTQTHTPAFRAAVHVHQMESRSELHPPSSWVSSGCYVGSQNKVHD